MNPSPLVRILLVLTVLTTAVAAHADSPEETFTRWQALRNPDRETIRFSEGYAFLMNHPGWPEEKLIRLRTEAAAMLEHPSPETMANFCTKLPPISGRGMIACASAHVGSKEQQVDWVKQGWKQGDFNEDEEVRIIKSYSDMLTRTDHATRMDRLLYEGRSAAAKRTMPLLPKQQHAMYHTRIAFINEEHKAPKLLKKLSAAEQRNTGLLFDRLRWRLKRDPDTLAELLKLAPNEVPYPELWWPMRAIAARDAINKRNYTLALAMVEPHGELSGEALADAMWLKGWIYLQHSGDAATAYKSFFKLYTNVYTPVSKARAAYWAARAADKNGKPDIAHEWWLKAARYPTVFYGQLAIAKLSPNAPLILPQPQEIAQADREALNQHELTIIAKTLASGGDKKLRDLFLRTLARQLRNVAQFSLLADLAVEIGTQATGVEIAKLALRNGFALISTGWPKITLPPDLPLEPALILAIIRQESEFDPAARSPSNAQGLMQLLPGTAQHIARTSNLPYSQSQLMEPHTNLTLGSAYLRKIIDGFDGSYILGIASYNAGPSNVRKWIGLRGTPPKNTEGAIDWIESIPFGETRNYVMRVMENIGVYRTLENPSTPLSIEKDLAR